MRKQICLTLLAVFIGSVSDLALFEDPTFTERVNELQLHSEDLPSQRLFWVNQHLLRSDNSVSTTEIVLDSLFIPTLKPNGPRKRLS